MAKKLETKKVNISAKSGKYVTSAFAKANKNTTVTMQVKTTKPSKKSKS